MRCHFDQVNQLEGVTVLAEEPADDLTPVEWMALAKQFEGKKVATIAKELGVGVSTVHAWAKKPGFLRAVERVKHGIEESITRGEFGVLARFKDSANEAVDTIITTMRNKAEPRLRFQAAVHIVEMSGFHAPKPAVTGESPERLIDQFTAEEARHFAATNEWPDRFKDQLARLGVNVLRAREDASWKPKIESVATQEPAEGIAIEEISLTGTEDETP